MDEEQINKINEVLDEHKKTIRRDCIVPVANHPRFDASMGFRTLDDAIVFIKSYMEGAEDIDPDQREDAASRDIALYRGGRILAVVRHGPGDVLEVTRFAPEIGSN